MEDFPLADFAFLTGGVALFGLGAAEPCVPIT